jgi:methylamine---glutamate N-methyltransferase subunit C
LENLVISNLFKIGLESDFPSGEIVSVSVNNVEIAVCNYQGSFFALNNRCPHRGGHLSDGNLVGADIICPLHKWDFDVRTGISQYDNRDQVETYQISSENGVLYINLSDVPPIPPKKDEYLSKWRRSNDERESSMAYIHQLSKGKSSKLEPMGTEKKVISFDSIQFLPGGIGKLPLLDDEEVFTKTIIGPNSKKPLSLRIPLFISHMSYGALSPESKISLAKGAKIFGTAMCSGEGGMLPDERAAAGQYIFEMGSGYFGFTPENIKKADAIDFKFGQAAKAGLGGILPAKKNIPEIAAVRGVPPHKKVHSPSRFTDLNDLDSIKKRINEIRKISDGPIGAKMAANRIEQDLEAVAYCGFDFVTIDGRGGGTGAAPIHVKDNIGIPTIYAIPRARKWLDENGHSEITLVATGGLRTPGDFVKALALGADCVAISTTAMMAIGCQQYRACHNNTCPVGIATQKSDLRKRFDIETSSRRLVNFLESTEKQMYDFCRMMGIRNISEINQNDIVTTDIALSQFSSINHAASYINQE